MNYVKINKNMKYTKQEAIQAATDFIKEVNKLEIKYSMTFNSDSGDIYFSFRSKDDEKIWDTISLGWVGDGSGIKVMEKIKNKEKLRQSALSKLTDDEKEALDI